MVALVVALGSTAAADGAYFAESFGIAAGRGALAGALGNPLHLRLGFGMRLGNVAIEPWALTELQFDRDGARFGIFGGDPKPGAADIAAVGLDVKYIVALERRVAMFVRGGPLAADGLGALDGYRGRGVGVAAGAQITGKVRALGFLWAPLFFVKRGPMVTGALFVDAGTDYYFLRKADAPAIHARVDHISIGFAVGSTY